MILGLDVGGSSIKWGLFDNDYNLVEDSKVIVEGMKPNEVINSITNIIEEHSKEVHQCGIGFPSVVDQDGYVHIAPNLTEFKEIPLLKKLKEKIDIPIKIDNDANVAALAEMELGAAKEANNFLYVTLGSGIGGAIIINRMLYKGDNSGAGEIGYTTIDKDSLGIGLSQNRVGILEEFIGRKQFVKKTSEILKLYPDSNLNDIAFDVKEISEQAEMEDQAAVEAVIWYGKILGIGLASAMNLLDIKTVVVGGGVSNLPELMYKTAYEKISQKTLPNISKDFKLKKARFSNQAGIYGAAVLAKIG